MKKILALIIAGAMMLSMGACSNEKPAETPTEPTGSYGILLDFYYLYTQ